MAGLITLLTDFGLEDAYVAAVKGVILGIAPGARIVDITHSIAPQDVRGAGFVLGQAAPWFPAGTVHVAVVDPGVGTRRRILAVEARGQVFLAPDNGLLGLAVPRRDVRRVFEVRRGALSLPAVSATFHGRDIFAPVAARLALGLPLEKVGPPLAVPPWRGLPVARTRWLGRPGAADLEMRGEVLHVDVYGNAVTSLTRPPGARLARLEAGDHVIVRLARTYAEGRAGVPLALMGSSGRLEVALQGSSAAATLGLAPGLRVKAIWRGARAPIPGPAPAPSRRGRGRPGSPGSAPR